MARRGFRRAWIARRLSVTSTIAALVLLTGCESHAVQSANKTAEATTPSGTPVAASVSAAAPIIQATSPAAASPTAMPPSSAPVERVPSPPIGNFLAADYRATGTLQVDLDGSGTPQVVVTAVGSVQDGGASGFAPSTVLLLVWDPIALRWTEAFDASKEQAYQTSSQQGAGPGLVDLNDVGPQVAVIHDQPGGGADLLYWVNSIGGNSGALLIGIVHYVHQIATLTYSDNGDEAHVGTFDVPTTASPGVAIVGSAPNQQVQVTLPWLTGADSRSQAARMYSFTVAPAPSSYDSYVVVSDTRSYVGVGLSTVDGTTQGRVGYVDPASPAAHLLQVGDLITGVLSSQLPASVAADLIGPVVLDEIAILNPGDTAALQVSRGGRQLVVPIKLGQWSQVASDMGGPQLDPM